MSYSEKNQLTDIKNEILRYISFWPIYLVFIIVGLILASIYLRYSSYQYQTTAKIEIIDKAQDSEMALPTAMTIFNRSMVNLENEMGVLNSYNLHNKVVKKLNSNIKYYSVGKLKKSLEHPDDLYKEYEIVFQDDLDIAMSFDLNIDDNYLEIVSYDENGEFLEQKNFKSLTTTTTKHNLPFDITIIDYYKDYDIAKQIKIQPIDYTVKEFIKKVQITKSGRESDQLNISCKYENAKIAEDYINKLMTEFDIDGINDRQLEYKRTMDFVDDRSEYLVKELELVEIRKKEFKESNNFINIESDAGINFSEQLTYDAEIFKSQSQLDLLDLLLNSSNDDEYRLLPMNIGLENEGINNLIKEYNLIIRERDKYLLSAGPKNNFLLNLEKQIKSFKENIYKSLINYKKSLEIQIKNLSNKEGEFEEFYSSIPENEKILRSIERELEVKESLFLLLLQKREEAAINFAVVKPSIKVIDYAMTSKEPVSPIPVFIYLGSFVISLSVPLLLIFLRIYFDNKVHTKESLISKLVDNLPVIGEIPFVNKQIFEKGFQDDRSILNESIRMMLSNLKYIVSENNDNKTFIISSSIKGEGKTMVSYFTSHVLSNQSKVLLVGADLRNPQIHRYINVDKSVKGLTDLIYKNDINNVKDYIIKDNKLDILISGSIPPNPSELLSSETFKNILLKLKSEYDYIILDTAPCVLVSDTFEISKLINVDACLYIFRANFTEQNVIDFVNEAHINNKINKISIVMNGVGNSSPYGYKYGYQYGYQYGYKYGYNYGYGYSYKNDS